MIYHYANGAAHREPYGLASANATHQCDCAPCGAQSRNLDFMYLRTCYCPTDRGFLAAARNDKFTVSLLRLTPVGTTVGATCGCDT